MAPGLRLHRKRGSARAQLYATVLLAGVGAASAPARAQGMGVADAAAGEAALVQFYGGGSPLTGNERAELDGAVGRAFANDPDGAKAAAASAVRLLDLLKRQDGAAVVATREAGRRAVAFGSLDVLGRGEEGATASRIAASHDPAVVSDPASRTLVTTETVKQMVEGNKVGARLFDVPPPPDEDAVPALADAIRRGWPGTDAGLREALSNAGRDLPFAAGFLGRSTAANRARFVATWRKEIMAASDPADRQFRLAEVMAFVGARGARSQGASGGGAAAAGSALMQAREMQALHDRAGRSLMMGCGVAAGAVMSPERRSFCQPSPFP